MKRAFYLLFLIANFLFAEDPKEFEWAASPDGKFFAIFVEESGHVCVLEMEQGEEIERYIFEQGDGLHVAAPTIAVNKDVTIASWVEYNCITSHCCVSFYDKTWGKAEVISKDALRVHTDSPPVVSLDSEYEISVAFIATDSNNQNHVQLTHFDNNQWKESETIFTNDQQLSHLDFVADTFGKKFFSWIKADDSLQILENREIILTTPFKATLSPTMCLNEEGSLMIGWMNDERAIQTALYDNQWSAISPIELDEDVIFFTLSTTPLGFMLFWVLNVEDPSVEMALYCDDSWETIAF